MLQKRFIACAICFGFTIAFGACAPAPTATPVPTVTASPTITPSVTPTESPPPTATPPATLTSTPTPPPTDTPAPTATATAKPTLNPEQQAKTIADQLQSRGIIPNDTDPNKAQIIRNAIEKALIHAPYRVTADQINEFMMKHSGGRNLRAEFDKKYGQYDVTFDAIIAAMKFNDPVDLFKDTTLIRPSKIPACKNTCVSLDIIEIADGDFADQPYYPLFVTLAKEAWASTAIGQADLMEQKPPPNDTHANGHIGETISLALRVYMLQQLKDTGHGYPNIDSNIGNDIDYAFSGGVVTYQ